MVFLLKPRSHGVRHASVIFAFVKLPLSEQDVVSLPLMSPKEWIVHDRSRLESNVFEFQAWSCQTKLEIWHSQHEVSAYSHQNLLKN